MASRESAGISFDSAGSFVLEQDAASKGTLSSPLQSRVAAVPVSERCSIDGHALPAPSPMPSMKGETSSIRWLLGSGNSVRKEIAIR
jgi:hypothetical protein